MKKLMMMLGILLAMPLFAADTPATLDTLRDQIATLTTTVNAMKQKIDDLRLGGAVGDIGAVKDTVSNQGVQVVHFEIAGSIRSQDSEYPWNTTYDSVPTYRDHGGNIPGVVVHTSNGITLPAGTYLFQSLPSWGSDPSPTDKRRGGGSAGYNSTSWWRWTGEAGHATERLNGDVVWRMVRPGVFTFASTTTIKVHMPLGDRHGVNEPPQQTSSIVTRFSGIIERL